MRTPTLYTFLCDLGFALIIFHVAPLLIAQARVPLDLSRTHVRQPTAACEHHRRTAAPLEQLTRAVSVGARMPVSYTHLTLPTNREV